MTRYARIEQGSVREVVETTQQIEDLYHPDLVWVELRGRPEIVAGWIVQPDGFSAPEIEQAPAVAPVINIEELARRMDELQEQLRNLGPGITDPRPGAL